MEIHSAPFQKLKSATFCYMVALKNEKNGKKKKRKNVRCTAKGKLFNVRAERVWKKKKKKSGEIRANILGNFSMNQSTKIKKFRTG